MPIFKRSKSEDKMTEVLGTKELPRVVTSEQLVQRCLNFLSDEEAVEPFQRVFWGKIQDQKTKGYTNKKGNGWGCGFEEEENEWNRQIR
jgi:hypothetical protein